MEIKELTELAHHGGGLALTTTPVVGLVGQLQRPRPAGHLDDECVPVAHQRRHVANVVGVQLEPPAWWADALITD